MATQSLSRSIRKWRIRVSTTAQRPADHGQSAYLPTGTSCSVFSHGGASNTVSCRVVEVDEKDPSAIILETALVLGLPGVTLYAGGETCEKSWVSRLSDTEFVVTWERQATAAADARIEAARIYKSGEAWTADQATLGSIGHPIDTTPADGDSDCSCRSVFLRNGYFAIRYGNETANSGTAPHLRTYQIRHNMLSWLVSGAPVSVGNKAYASQQWDDDDATPTLSGGYALGELAVTGKGDVLSVWETRTADGGNFDSAIQYRLLAGLYHATPLTELATGTLKTIADSDTLALRRPRLASLNPQIFGAVKTDPTDSGEQILMTYGQEDVSASTANAAKMLLITINAGAAVSVQDIPWRANLDIGGASEKMGSSCVTVGPDLACGIAVADYDAAAGRTFSVQHVDGRHEYFAQGTDWPDRPSGEVWVSPSNGKQYLFLSTEGYDLSGGSATLDRFLELRELVNQ